MSRQFDSNFLKREIEYWEGRGNARGEVERRGWFQPKASQIFIPKSKQTQDVDVDTSDPVQEYFYQDSSDYEALTQEPIKLVDNEPLAKNAALIVYGVMLVPKLRSIASTVTRANIRDVLEDGQLSLQIDSTKLVTIDGYEAVKGEAGDAAGGNDGAGSPIPVRPGTVGFPEFVEFGKPYIVEPGSRVRLLFEYDGSRWSGLSMSTDFDITARMFTLLLQGR